MNVETNSSKTQVIKIKEKREYFTIIQIIFTAVRSDYVPEIIHKLKQHVMIPIYLFSTKLKTLYPFLTAEDHFVCLGISRYCYRFTARINI